MKKYEEDSTILLSNKKDRLNYVIQRMLIKVFTITLIIKKIFIYS